MNFYMNIFLNIIYITYPLLLFLFYVAYSKNIKKEENNLFLDIALISSTYLIIRFCQPLFDNTPIVIFNAILIIAYLRNRNITAIILSIVFILYYIFFSNFNVLVLFIEYILYFILYIKLINTENFEDKYINYFVLIKLLFFLIQNILITNIYTIQNVIFITHTIIMILILYLVTYFSFMLFEKGEEIIKYHMSIKELEKEKQIRTSLFKITHEIKNPIAVCKGYLDMFDTNNLEHSVKYIPILREEIERVLIILQDFLSLTKSNINKEPIDIYLLIDDVIDDFKPILKSHNILLQSSLPDEELYIDADYNRLKQVFINVIKNSVEAIDKEKKGLIKVFSKKENSKIKIYIEDNGIGMSKETLKKIKEPFFTTKNNGTGLGTSLSTEIIKAHNGEINYSSTEHNGTPVEIILDSTM